MNKNININLEYLKEKKELVSFVLLCFSVLLIVLTLYIISDFYSDSAKIERTILEAAKLNERPQEEIDNILASTKEFANALKQNNAFAPYVSQDQMVQAPVNPVTEVRGILGKSAYINGRWYTVGDSIGSAKVVAIKPLCVTIEFNGISTDYYPYQASILESAVSQTGGNNLNSGMNNLMNMNVSDLLQRLTGSGRGGGMMGGMGGGRGGMGGMGGGRGGGGMGGGRGGGMGGGGGGGRGGGGMGGGRGGGGGFGGGFGG